jgi:hypothetical protein
VNWVDQKFWESSTGICSPPFYHQDHSKITRVG